MDCLRDLCKDLKRSNDEVFKGFIPVIYQLLFQLFTLFSGQVKNSKNLRDDLDVLTSRQLNGERIDKVEVESLNTAYEESEKRLNFLQKEYNAMKTPLSVVLMRIAQVNPDTFVSFIADFTKYIQRFNGKVPPLQTTTIDGKATLNFAPVCADGACLFRAFLTSLANQINPKIILPYDPEEIHLWIIRLKFLMLGQILEMAKDPDFLLNLTHIPRNGKVENLMDYFGIFLSYDYNGTDIDFKILSTLFQRRIHIISENPKFPHQCFVPKGSQGATKPSMADICILHQSYHFVAIVGFEQINLPAAAFACV